MDSRISYKHLFIISRCPSGSGAGEHGLADSAQPLAGAARERHSVHIGRSHEGLHQVHHRLVHNTGGDIR